MKRLFLLISSFVVVTETQRPKIKDHHGVVLIDLSDVGTSCVDSYTGYAIVDGSLERCENLTAVLMGQRGQKEYEEYKCTYLRVHGVVRNEKCVCKEGWKGPTCNYFEQCPLDTPSLLNGVCTKHGCAHDGIMAIGAKQLECICKNQWDGRRCERIACWRLSDKGFHFRYRNDKDGKTCMCGTHFEGENCSVLKSCEKHGELKNGACDCEEGYGGEICHRKCPPGLLTCSTFSTSALISLSMLAILTHFIH